MAHPQFVDWPGHHLKYTPQKREAIEAFWSFMAEKEKSLGDISQEKTFIGCVADCQRVFHRIQQSARFSLSQNNDFSDAPPRGRRRGH